jgi:hypothetical protein
MTWELVGFPGLLDFRSPRKPRKFANLAAYPLENL